MTPSYSICMCNYNMGDTIERSLRTLFGQLDERFEIIVVDDGSDDDSVAVLRRLEADFPILRVFTLQRDSYRKLGATRNYSIEQARGEYVLLHLDCDDIFGPYLSDFVKVFHEIEKVYDYDILLSGQHINMIRRQFIIDQGMYENMYRGEDRNLWSRMAAIDAYIPMDHMDFVVRLPKTRSKRLSKAIVDTFDHMCNDHRSGIALLKYYQYEFAKRRSYSLRLFLFRLFMLIPSKIASLFMPPIVQARTVGSAEEFAAYRERVRGTYAEIVARRGGKADFSILSPGGRRVFTASSGKLTDVAIADGDVVAVS